METVDLRINKGYILSVKHTKYGRVYEVSVDGNIVNICARYYDTVARFMSNEFGLETDHVVNKDVTLISDEERLLAINSVGTRITFIQDLVDTNFVTTLYGNTDYIMDKYGLTPEEFISLATEQLNQSRLKKEING